MHISEKWKRGILHFVLRSVAEGHSLYLNHRTAQFSAFHIEMKQAEAQTRNQISVFGESNSKYEKKLLYSNVYSPWHVSVLESTTPRCEKFLTYRGRRMRRTPHLQQRPRQPPSLSLWFYFELKRRALRYNGIYLQIPISCRKIKWFHDFTETFVHETES